MPGARLRVWPRFSLRQLLAGMVAIALVLAWWSEQARETRQIAATLRRHGMSVTYAVERKRSRLMTPIIFAPGYRPSFYEKTALKFLNVCCQRPDFTSHIDGVTMLRRGPLPDEVRQCLPRLRRLWCLNVAGSDFKDDDLRALTCSASLEWLDCDGTEITDEGIKSLARFKNLKTLGLRETHVTDQGLLNLASLRTLQDLRFESRDENGRNCISYEIVERLRAALPGCAFAGSSRLPAR